MRSSAVDGTDRVWMASRLRERGQQPDFCASAENRFGACYPLTGASRQVSRCIRPGELLDLRHVAHRGGKGEGGPGVLPKVVKFEMRPDPLAH